MLEYQIIKACQSVNAEVVTKYSRDIDIANFINLSATSIKNIRQAANEGIPTILWLFYANNDASARIVETKKDGKYVISQSRLDVINMMDAVIVPSQDAKFLLRTMKVRIPIFVIPGAVSVRRIDELKEKEVDIFKRYFRINEEQEYAISVMNIKAQQEIDELALLADAVPKYYFYAFVSANANLIDNVKIKTLDRKTPKNLIISKLVPEDVYRSGLLGAKYFIDLGQDKINAMTMYEPMHVKIPLIVRRQAIFSDIIDDNKAIVVRDFNGAAYAIRNNAYTQEKIDNAYKYTEKYTSKTFNEAIVNLFKKIYSR